MKLKDKQALHQLTLPKLQTKLAKLTSKLAITKLNIAAKKKKNTGVLSAHKNQIAIIKTIIRQKQLAK